MGDLNLKSFLIICAFAGTLGASVIATKEYYFWPQIRALQQDKIENPGKYFVFGTVIESKYSPPTSPKEDSSYILKIKTDGGENVALDVLNQNRASSGTKKEGLELLIKKGAKIKFSKQGEMITLTESEKDYQPGVNVLKRQVENISVLEYAAENPITTPTPSK